MQRSTTPASLVLLFIVGITILPVLTGCGRAAQPPAAPAGSEPTYVPEATVRDLMVGIVDTSADDVWLSVRETVTDKGVVETRPKDDEAWAEVRYGALRLVESANLLMMPGRRVARPGEKSIAPGVELEPTEIQAMIEKDPAGWNERAKALHDAAMLAVRAAEAQDADRIFEVGETIEHACEGCHRHFWYPNEVIPELPAAPVP
jgi:hypothetical protein